MPLTFGNTGTSTGEAEGSNTVWSNYDSHILGRQALNGIKRIDALTGLTTNGASVICDLKPRDLADDLEIFAFFNVRTNGSIQCSCMSKDNQTTRACDREIDLLTIWWIGGIYNKGEVCGLT